MGGDKPAANISTSVRLIRVDESEAFFNLIDNNRSRLQDYFPKTVRTMVDVHAAKTFLQGAEDKKDKRDHYLFGMYAGDQLIGCIHVKNIDWNLPKCELGYYIDAQFSGRGLTVRCMREVLDFCFNELNMKKVFLRIDPANMGSKRVAEKTGFVQEGLLRNEFRLGSGELIDVAYYGHVGGK